MKPICEQKFPLTFNVAYLLEEAELCIPNKFHSLHDFLRNSSLIFFRSLIGRENLKKACYRETLICSYRIQNYYSAIQYIILHVQCLHNDNYLDSCTPHIEFTDWIWKVLQSTKRGQEINIAGSYFQKGVIEMISNC